MQWSVEAPGRGLRVAFAGAGHWHFAVDASYLALAKQAECEIVGLSDDDESVARARAETAGCPWTTSIDELVSRFKPDLVVALPRPDRAPEQVGQLLDLGVPLFAEKPLGVSAAGAWSLVDRAERGWVTVSFPQRYAVIWQKLDELRQAGRLGHLGHVGMRQLNGPPWRYRNYEVPWMLDPVIAGGGPLRNIGIHLADALQRLFEPSDLRVVGAARNQKMYAEPIEDVITAVMQTPDGTIATLETGYSFMWPKTGRRAGDTDFHFAGTGAFVAMRRDRLEIHPYDGDSEIIDLTAPRPLYQDIFFDALVRFRTDQAPVATVRDCARANDIIDAIYAAAG
jgi:predicted dehydrogenase